LAGLLCLAPAGCSSTDDGASGSGQAGATAAAGSTAAAGADGSLGGASDSGDGGAAGSAAPSLGSAGDSAGSAGAASAGAASAGAAGASTGGAASAGAGTAGASTGGSAGAGADPNEPPHITSSTNAGVLTEADFKALCDARGGTVELMPHCGGFATAKGFSYDNGTQLLSEHTCAGANTCGGWNCVLTD
jgi:hypothetical protein